MAQTVEALAALSLQTPGFTLDAFARERAYADAESHCGPEGLRLVHARRFPGAEGDPLFPDVDAETVAARVRGETWWLVGGGAGAGARAVCRAQADVWYTATDGVVTSCAVTHRPDPTLEGPGLSACDAGMQATMAAATRYLARPAHCAFAQWDGLDEYLPLLRPQAPPEWAEERSFRGQEPPEGGPLRTPPDEAAKSAAL
jgi:hypothetical protein